MLIRKKNGLTPKVLVDRNNSGESKRVESLVRELRSHMLPGPTEEKSSFCIWGEFSGGLLVRVLGFHCLDPGLGELRSCKLHFVAKKLKKKLN